MAATDVVHIAADTAIEPSTHQGMDHFIIFVHSVQPLIIILGIRCDKW
jgi:hypothetical protein